MDGYLCAARVCTIQQSGNDVQRRLVDALTGPRISRPGDITALAARTDTQNVIFPLNLESGCMGSSVGIWRWGSTGQIGKIDGSVWGKRRSTVLHVPWDWID